MSLLTDVYAIWTADVNNPPLPSLSAATDILQADGPTITDQQGDDWWNAVAAEYDRLGIISGAGTYNQLRAEVNSAGETVSNELFIALQGTVIALPETGVIVTALTQQALIEERDQIPADITTIETDRDLQSDQALIDAYNAGIAALNKRLGEINLELFNLGVT